MQCSHRWNKVLAPGLTKGKWTAEEDGLLTKLYSCQAGVVFEEFASNAQGEVRGGLRVMDSQTAKSIQSSINWRSIATKITGRNAKQCRERWCNYLDPSLKCGNWTKKEDRQLMALVKKKSKKWSAVAFGSVKCSVVYQERSTKLSSSYEVSKRSTKCRASNQSSLWPFLLF